MNLQDVIVSLGAVTLAWILGEGIVRACRWGYHVFSECLNSVVLEREQIEDEQDWIARSRAGYSTDWHV